MADASSDARAREGAVDPTRSVLLQAPAGSGKTTVLTQRLLRLLAVVEEPEQILAITFTRKAAAEMRARVLRALRGQIDSHGAQADRLRELARAALDRSAARGWDLVAHPGRLRVQTIDSFNFWLASQLPLASRAGGTLRVADRPEEAYLQAARSALTAGDAEPALVADVGLLFERLDNSWSRVERLLADMLGRRGHWLRHVLESDADLGARIGEGIAAIAGDHLRLAHERLSAAIRATGECVYEIGELGAEPRHLAAWQRLAAVALTKKDEWRTLKAVNKSLGSAYEQAAVKDALKSCIELWSSVPGALDSLRELRQLPGSGLEAADAAAIAALARVLRRAAAELHAGFARSGLVDHTFVAGAARQALAEEGRPTDLALRTGFSLRHILVDEFQDTSIGQFDLLEALTVGWEPGDGRTLFVVGDPMQSIYQFREAEVGLFLRARDGGIGTVRLEAMRLLRNFRSVPGLIGWCNEVFAGIFPPVDDLRASAVAFTPSVAQGEAASAAPVEMRLFTGENAGGEAPAVAARIAELRRQDARASVAVLVASRSHAVPIMAELDAVGISAIGVELVPLADLPIVRDLVALLRALHHLGDRTSWLSVLRAPWCGLSLHALTILSWRGDSALVWEAAGEPDRLQRIDADDRARLERIREVLREALDARDRSPVAEWLERVWMRLGAPDAYAVAELRHARAFFRALAARASSPEWRGPHDVGALLGELYAQPDSRAADAVQVMTIHRAKGLEFDHVFVPCLDRRLNHGAEPLLRWLDLPRRGGGSDLVMAPVPPVGPPETTGLNAYLKRLMGERAANERARLLYVAATRARRSLHLSAAPKVAADGTVVPAKGTLLASLWPAVGAGFATRSAEPAEAANLEEVSCSLRRLRSAWRSVPLPQAGELPGLPIRHDSLGEPEFSWAGETVRHIGTVVHAALERFASDATLPSRADVAASRKSYGRQLFRLGVPEPQIPEAAAEVLEALERTLQDERGRWILAVQHPEAQSELALTGIAGGRLMSVSIDRSFVDAASGTRWVIDFKTGRHKGGDLEAFLAGELERYRPQLESYAALARSLGPQPVRAALYFPLLGVFRELPLAR
jgi:ATP-dependent helicase/nuclease subunit A